MRFSAVDRKCQEAHRAQVKRLRGMVVSERPAFFRGVADSRNKLFEDLIRRADSSLADQVTPIAKKAKRLRETGQFSAAQYWRVVAALRNRLKVLRKAARRELAELESKGGAS